jgi:hypothetical protein
MLETGTSGLMSGDEKRGDVSASVPALVLDSTITQILGWLRAEAACASRWKRARVCWFWANASGRNFMATKRCEVRDGSH